MRQKVSRTRLTRAVCQNVKVESRENYQSLKKRKRLFRSPIFSSHYIECVLDDISKERYGATSVKLPRRSTAHKIGLNVIENYLYTKKN